MNDSNPRVSKFVCVLFFFWFVSGGNEVAERLIILGVIVFLLVSGAGEVAESLRILGFFCCFGSSLVEMKWPRVS